MRIFYEFLNDEVFIDVFLSEEDLEHLKEGRLICRDTIVPVQDEELFNKKVSVGIIAPQADQVADGIWDEEIEEEERE